MVSLRSRLLLVWMLTVGVVGASAFAEPPRVVRATPDNGSVGVDPGLGEIVVVFDQPMSTGGRSIVGGGESFPEIVGEITWRDARTIVIPVRLRPDHEYWLSINNERFRNFRNTRGEPAVPYPIRFRTGAGGRAEPDGAGAGFGAQVDRAIGLLETAYSYRDRAGVDWRALLEEHRGALSAAGSPELFAADLGTLLARAEDKHVWLGVGDRRFPTFVRPRVPNANPALLPALVEGFEQRSPRVSSGTLAGGRVGYLAVHSWDAARRDDIEAAFDAIWALDGCEAMVLDVRLNGGGDEMLAREVAGCFIGQSVAYAKHRTVAPDRAGGFSEIVTREVAPNTRRPKFRGPVAVLIGPVCMSSNEAFVLMMRAGGARLVGGRTQGSSGNPRPHDLGRGVTLYLPSWQAMTLDGAVFEGVGIGPDVLVEPGPGGFDRSDPVLERAVEVLLGG